MTDHKSKRIVQSFLSPEKIIARFFSKIAESIEKDASQASMNQVLTQAAHACSEQKCLAKSASLHKLFSNLEQVLAAWISVWPRMGGRREFRNAVLREANRWIRELKHMESRA